MSGAVGQAIALPFPVGAAAQEVYWNSDRPAWRNPARDTASQTTTATLSATSARTQYVDGSGGAFTVNLPDATTVTGAWFEFKRIDAGTGAVTLDPSGSQTIDGETTVRLYGRVSVMLLSDGSNWRVLHGRDVLHPFAHHVRPEWFGAKADGSTDDQAALQAAYTVANAVSGNTVRYKRGRTYVVGSGVSVLGNTTSDFNGATVKVKAGVTGFNVFVSGGVNNVRYRDGIIDLNKANVTDPASINLGIGIYFAPTSGNSTGNAVQNVHVKDGHQVGIRVQGHNAGATPSSMNPTEVLIDGCTVTGCLYPIYLTRVTNSRITNNRIDDAGSDGITLNFHRDTIVANNVVEDTAGHGIVGVYGIGYAITSNVVRRAGNSGIANGGGSYTAAETNRYYTITGNVCEGCGAHGITHDPTITSGTFETTYATCTGNVCRDNGIHGIYVNNVKGITLTGNECQDNTQSGIAAYGSYHTIVGNHCYDNGTYGIDVQGASGGDAEGYHTIHSNNLHGNATAPYTFSQYLTDVDGAVGSKTFDWPDLATGAEQTTTVTVYGAVLGMAAEASMSVSLAGTKLFAYVSAANTVTVVQRNDTGGNVNLASGTLRATVRRMNA